MTRQARDPSRSSQHSPPRSARPVRLSRRAVLRGGAGAAIALPFLEAMERWMPAAATGRAAAQAAERPKRFIAYCQPLGTFGEVFFPPGPGGTLYEWPEEACAEGKCRARVFRSGDGWLDDPSWRATEILAPLDRHRDDVIVLENVDNATGNHKAYAAMLTGWVPQTSSNPKYARGISIDQELAKHLGPDTKFASLQLGVKTSSQPGTRQAVSWYDEAEPAMPEAYPRAVFDRVFAGVTSNPDAMGNLLAERRSILDAALDQASSLRAQLGAADRERVDSYLESVREVERRLAILPDAASCSRPEEPRDFTERDLRDLSLVPEVTRTQLDLLAMAMACDLTRVATFQMSFEATNIVHTWLGGTGRWHDLSHNGGSGTWQPDMRQYVDISVWNAQQMAYLIDRLRAFEVFDDTTVLWINPMHNGQIHNADNLPLVLAGNLGGALRTGRHLRVPRDRFRVNDLHAAILQGCGVDADHFGDPELNDRPLTELLA